MSDKFSYLFKSEVKEEIKKNHSLIKIYNLEQSRSEILNLIKEEQTFEVSETTNSCKIKIFKNGGSTVTYWYIESTKSEKFLILLNKLKREIKAREQAVNDSKFSNDEKNTKYFFFAKNFTEVSKDSGSMYDSLDVYEADVSHAYYRAAYVLGFISKMLYLEIIRQCTKHDRLRLLGCIATVKTYEFYDKGIFKNGEIKKNELLRDAWFKICNYIDTALLELRDKLGKDFLFYWVDGIYFKHIPCESPLEDLNFFKSIRSVKYKYDLDFKIIKIKRFELINRDKHIEIVIHKPDGKKKRFFPNKKNVKTYSLVDENGLNKI